MNDAQKCAAIERMISNNGAQLLRLCFLYLRDMALAEDAVQDTFVKAYRGLDAFRGDSAEKTWLTTIAVNTCRTYMRGSWHRRVDARAALDKLAAKESAWTKQDDKVTECVMELPQKYREVVLMHYYQGFRVREIACALGVTENAVSTRLLRAKAKLKELYIDE